MIKKYLKKKINGIKICAIITTVCFMVSTLGANLYAIPISENTNKKYEDVFNNASSISSEYGKITALKDANSDVTVVNIQDLHCHPQTQRNISKIIASLANKYNLKSIYVEGGYGNIDTTWLSSIKDESLRKQVIEHLLEEGILTGSEYYNLTSNKNNIELKGIDEEKLHQDNIKRLSWIMDNQGKYREIIKKINKEISFLEIKYINNENKRFNKNIDKYLSNEIDTKRFYRQLIKYVKDINKNPQKYNNITSIKLEDYPNIMRYMTLTKISQKINVKEITSQLYAIINEIKNKVPYDVYTKFVKESDNFQDSQKVVELVTLLCEKSGIDLDNKYESLKKFLQSNEINRNLNTVELVQEERHLIGEIRKALSYNNEEYEITFISDFNKYFQDYLQYKLTEVDWLYFKNSYKEFRNLYGKYAAVDRIKEIEKDFTEINKYYEINDERNNIFVKNLLQNEKPQIIQTNTVRKEEDVLKNSKEVIIAVTGGFHSKALENILQAKEVNTIVITPSIYDGIEKATKQYKGIIKDQSKLFQSSALAYKIASSLKDSDKQKILYRIVKDIVGDNTEKLKEILGKDVDLSVLENLSPLSEQEQQEAAEIKGKIETAASVLIKYLPVQGGQSIFYPKMDDIILGVSIFLVENGIFFSDGTRLEIENSGSPDLSGIPAETYSRMLDDIQKALFSSQNLSDIAEEGVIEKAREDNNNESKKQGKRKRQSQQTRKGKNKRGVQEKTVERPVFDRAPLTSDREKELLARFYGNRRALNKLIEIDKSMLIGLEQDSELLNIIVDRIKDNIYNEKYLDEFLDVCKECIDFEDSTEDKIIKVRNIKKYLDRFLSEFEDEYVDYFKKLFSLGIQVIKYFNEDFVEVEYVADLMLRDEQLANGTLKDNLEILIGKYDKAFFDPFFCGAVIEPLIDNIDKVNNLSQDDMLYITTLPIGLLNVILNKSQNDSDLLKVIKYVRANFDDISSLPDIIFDILEHKSVNVNSEQLIDIFKYLIYNLDDISLLPGTIFNVLKAKTANAEQLMGIFKYLLDNLDYVVDELDKPDDKNKEIITAIDRKIKTIQEFETVIETLKKCNVTKHWSSKKEQVLDAIKNIEKIENLSSLTFSQLMLFDNESISFVLNNARSSSDIETVISRYYDFGVSSYKNDKDAKQAKVKALVKYVSESDKSFYDKLFSYGTDALNIIVDSIDDVSFVKDYILNSDYKGIYENLFKELVELEIKNVAFENNYLALKLILNEDFNKILLASKIENISDPKNIVARYYSAIAVSRFIYDSFGKEVYDYRFDDKELIGVIEDVTSTYVHMMKKMLEIVLIDSNTKIYALCNSERHSNGDRFNVKSLREIIKYMGIPVTISEENVYRREGDNTEASEGWLEAIMSFEMDSNGTKGYFVFRGHGGEKALVVYDPGVVDAEKQISNGRATGDKAESITPQQLADALYELATKKHKPVDLRNITIDLSCCNSYFFARNVYDILEQKFKKEGKEESYPTIITAAGLETKTGITDLTIMEGNLHKGIKRLLDKFQEGTVKVLSLGMIGVSEYLFKNSNITMFTSFFDKSTLDLIDKTRENVSKSTCFTTVKTDSKKDSSVSTEKEVTENDTVSEIKIKPLSKKVVELTIPISAGKNRIQNIIINKLKKYPHIWEELFYRDGPALLASMTIFALMPLTAISNLFIIPAILFGIFIFSISQRKFIEAHILEDWISKQNLTSKEIRALRIFGKFPTKEKEEEFKRFSEQENNRVKKESIRKATGKLIAPYIISISLAFIVPAIPVIIATTSAATITAQVYHYEHNEEQKEILDIENEFAEIGYLMSNPDAREVTETSLISLVNRNKAISVFNSVIDDLMKRINDDQVRSQLEEITVADLEKNIDEINKYGEVVERLATLAKQIDQFKGDKEIKQEMESQFLYFIDGLCEKLVLLYKDETTGYHALRSTRNVVEKAKYLNLSLEEKYKLTIAGLMHDIGKNLSPDGILNKPGSLTSEEELVMHAHVWLGGCILKGSRLHDFSEIAENHHFTNSSLRQYSARSLTGDPFFSQEGDNLSKIFSLMDVFEAVSYKISIDSERPYQLVAYPESFREIILFDAIEDLLQQIENGKTTLDLSVSERNFLIDTIRNKQIEIKRAQEELEKIIDEKFALQRQRNKESDEKKQKELDSKLAAIGNEIAEKQKIVSELKENFENYIFYNETDNVVVQHIRRETSLIEILNKIKELDKEDINAIKELVDDLLYQETNDEMILFVRNKKREIVREKAFSTISTLDIQTVVAKMLFPQEDENIVKEKFRTDPKYWQEQKQKFIEEFKRNPKLWSNRIWDAIDKFRVEFEEENLKTFFEFYFNEEDERISGEMLGIFSRIEQYYKDTTTNMVFISPVVMFFNRAKNFMSQLNIFGSSINSAILPENMSTVNTMLQQGRSALRVATWVVLQEADFALSMEQDENGEYAFIKAHGDNTSGAIELMKFIENWQNKTKWLNKIAPRLAQKILRQASIVKHIAIDYRFIKASGIQEAIKMFGKNARLNEDGQVEVAIVEDIEQLQNSFTLINTGLKINGASIYRIKDSDLLMFGAKGQQSIKIVQAIDGTEQLKKSVKEMLNAMGEQIDEVETQGIVRKDGEGIEIKEGVIEIGEMSLKGKTSQQIKEFITSSLEINRATGIMYGQKTIIDLGHDESIKIVSNDDNNLEKLKLAIENGRARKVITKEQYDSLKKDKNNEKEDGFKEYLIELRENGIELYIDNSNGLLSEQEIENSKKDGIVGQIITKEGKVLIHDYYSEDKTELLKVDSEILKKKSLEQIILSSDKPIFVGIEILKEQFKQQNINVVQREFGALLGKIKLGLNIGTLNQYDVENMGYNISFEKVPELTQEQISGLFEKDETGKLQIVSKDKITQTIGTENSFAIILNSIKDEKTQIRFKEILVERILAKSSLKQQNKEYGLKDKKMEILLGQMLLKQVDKKDKQTINLDDNFKGTKEDIIRKIMEETQRANEGNETAINTIIEIILVYGEDRKLKQIEGEEQKNISSGYRAMLSAA